MTDLGIGLRSPENSVLPANLLTSFKSEIRKTLSHYYFIVSGRMKQYMPNNNEDLFWRKSDQMKNHHPFLKTVGLVFFHTALRYKKCGTLLLVNSF